MARKPKYKSAEDMQWAIDAYFTYCDGHAATDESGHVLTDKYGNPIILGAHPPTVTGLAWWLGFESRQSLLNYEGRNAAFRETIRTAKLRIEAYTEERLFDRDGQRGAQFSLEHNFRWNKQENDDGGGGVVMMPPLRPDSDDDETTKEGDTS